MRFALKNKCDLYYAQLQKSEPIYELDENGEKIIADTINGVDYYVENGQTEPTYSAPVPFKGTIKEGGSDADDKEFGLDFSQYTAIMVIQQRDYPINETSLIWETTPTVVDGHADPSTADYEVVKKSNSMNTTRYALHRIVK